ncbi:hypothetical protein GGI08_008192 [Coemansia sp. S2]|nr:hypothetical protein LPJ71_004120 [Coemansia sp. S17]KAJ2018198.1 hypothetical protein GGI14_002455 [Coemansia sp. S680]KAJ2039472.1 hypothetical protein GGI08_008192 [Coemansia sp. S2]KAJ2334571.1 hypothetical protein GGH92_008281 [Coemansia sp. RSA 2673]
MVCAICYEPYFKALPKSIPGREAASLATAALYRLTTLGCGHVFHKKCIDAWFASNKAQRCAQCNVAHVGKPTVLFLEMDDDDNKASKGSKDGGQNSSDDPRGNSDMHELTMGMACVGIYNKSGEYYVTANLAKHSMELEARNNELVRELEEVNNLLEIERSNREEDDVDNLKLELEEERNVRRRKEDSLRTMHIHLQRELLEVARLSNENKKLKEEACQISLLQRELRADRRVLNAYEDKFGPYSPADFSRFSHNGPPIHITKRSRKF